MVVQIETLEQVVERLAGLFSLEYEQVRRAEADKLGVRIQVLDDEVAKARPKDKSEFKENALWQKQAEPWPHQVNGEQLFSELVSIFTTYLFLQKYQAEALALWCIESYSFDAGNILPKLLIYSPEKRCGKTTLLDVLIGLVWKPLAASNISPASIYRIIESVGGTIIIDEADTFIKNNPEITGIVNSGHRKSLAHVIRCDGDDHEPKSFSTWTPNIIAMIGKPADTLVDRSILIEMRRKKPGDNVARFEFHKMEPGLKIIASKIARWCKDNFEALQNSDPVIPAELNDRARDNWRPLFAIADLISEDCANVARLAACALSVKDNDNDNSSPGVRLLADIRDIFESEASGRIKTSTLLQKLLDMEDSPWPEWNRGRPISPSQISRILRPYNIRPKKIRFGADTAMGYELCAFTDAFDRYLIGTTEQNNKGNMIATDLNGTLDVAVPEKPWYNPLNINDCSRVLPDYSNLPG